MNKIIITYKYQYYEIDIDSFQENKGYFILDGKLAHADSFEDLMNEKIDVGINITTAKPQFFVHKTVCGVQVEFVNDKPVGYSVAKDELDSNQIKQYWGQVQHYCNENFPHAEGFDFRAKKLEKIKNTNRYFGKIVDDQSTFYYTKEYQDYLHSR